MKRNAAVMACGVWATILLSGCGGGAAPGDGPRPAADAAPGPPVAERNLKSLELNLPPPPGSIASYVPAVRTGSLLFVSGQLPMREGKLLAAGRVGEAVTEEQAGEAMKAAALNALAVIRAELGSLDRVRRVVRVVGYVACTGDFGNQPQVTNAASDLFLQVFGRTRGGHSRLALGAASLPRNSPVELDVIVEVEP